MWNVQVGATVRMGVYDPYVGLLNVTSDPYWAGGSQLSVVLNRECCDCSCDTPLQRNTLYGGLLGSAGHKA